MFPSFDRWKIIQYIVYPIYLYFLLGFCRENFLISWNPNTAYLRGGDFPLFKKSPKLSTSKWEVSSGSQSPTRASPRIETSHPRHADLRWKAVGCRLENIEQTVAFQANQTACPLVGSGILARWINPNPNHSLFGWLDGTRVMAKSLNIFKVHAKFCVTKQSRHQRHRENCLQVQPQLRKLSSLRKILFPKIVATEITIKSGGILARVSTSKRNGNFNSCSHWNEDTKKRDFQAKNRSVLHW